MVCYGISGVVHSSFLAIRDLIHFTVDKALECIHVCLFVSFKPLFKDFEASLTITACFRSLKRLNMVETDPPLKALPYMRCLVFPKNRM